MVYLFLLFTITPIVELWLLLTIGGAIGFWPTLGLTIASGVIGAWLAKREGRRVLDQYRRAVAEMRMPEEGLVSGLLVLVGGVLLVAPGVISDIVGITLLFPPTRKVVAKLLQARLAQKFEKARTRGSLQVRIISNLGSFRAGGPRERATSSGAGGLRDVIDTTAEVIDDSPRALLPPKHD